ncbi:MAG: hypothetical protein AAGN82_10825 [Myxococcota bacterium]
MLRSVVALALVSACSLLVGCDDGGGGAPLSIAPIPGGGGPVDGDRTEPGTPPPGAAAPTPAPAGEPACTRDVAFRAAGLSFLEPTPPNLADRFNQLGYGYDAQGLTVALRAAEGAEMLAVSATADVSGAHRFAGTAPLPVGAQLSAGGFETTAAQDDATLQLWVDGALVDIPLRNVNVRARTLGDCAEAWVFIDAVIPESAADIDLGAGETLTDLAGPTKGTDEVPGIGWPVQIMFATESVPFDFADMAEAP